MKIATQLLNTTPSPVIKTGASLDGGAGFEGVLVAATEKKINTNDLPRAKSQTQDAKSQAPETRKKSVASDSTVAENTMLDVAASQQIPSGTMIQFTSSLLPTPATPTVPSDQILNDAPNGTELTGGSESQQSTTNPLSSVIQLPTNTSAVRWGNQQIVNESLTSVALSVTTRDLPVIGEAERSFSNASPSHSGPLNAQVAAGQSVRSQGVISSAMAKSTPVTPVLSTAVADGTVHAPIASGTTFPSSPIAVRPVAATNTASSLPVAVSPVDSTALAASSNAGAVNPVIISPVVPTVPAATATSVSASSVASSTVTSPAPVVAAASVPPAPITVTSDLSPLPKAAEGNVSASPIAVAPAALIEIADATKLPVSAVPAPPVAASVPNALVKIASASPIVAPPVIGERNVAAPSSAVPQFATPVSVATEKATPASSIEVTKVDPNLPEAATLVFSAHPIPQSVSPKVDTTDQRAPISSATDLTNLNSANPVFDPTQSAAQQTTAAVVQSIAASVSLPGSSSVNAAQATPIIAANQATIAGRVGDSGKEVSSRQTTSVVKSKPGSGTSTSADKFADGSGTYTQAQSESTTTSSSVVKAAEPSEGLNQSASDFKSLDIASLQQTAPNAAVNHPSKVSPSLIASGGATAQTVPQQPVPENQPMQGVSSAQLIQSMRSSEMKLGMQSAEFGNISISTSLNHQALSAQISIDHSELGRALAVHLPAIEEKLGSAYGVQAKVELRDSNNPPSSNDSGYSNSGQQSREQRQSQGSGIPAVPGATFQQISARGNFASLSTTTTATRLDIRI